MPTLSIQPPYPIFTDSDGTPLEDGYVWLGSANLDPQTNPIAVYWDAGLTQPAAQPVRTIGGYPSNNGTPGRLYVNSDYSIRVMNKNASTVYSSLFDTERYSDIVVLYSPSANSLLYPSTLNLKQSLDAITDSAAGSTVIGFVQPSASAVNRNVRDKLRDIVSIADFGASATASASDNTAAINAAASYAATSGAYLIGIPATLTVNGTIQLNCDGDLSMMTIEANANLVSPIVRFGSTSNPTTSYKNMSLPRVRNNSRTSGTWGAGTAIELANCNTCKFYVPSATECLYGLRIGGYTSGFAYNIVDLGFIYSNKINIYIAAQTASGWANQNTFIGGRLGINTNDFTTSGYVGTRDILIGNSLQQTNNNIFINTSIETALLEYSIEFSQSTAWNMFQMCRYEGTQAKKILFNTNIAAGHSNNVFFGGYQSNQLDFTFSGTGTSVYNSVYGAAGNNFVNGTGPIFSMQNSFSGSITGPQIQGFNAGTDVLNKDASAVDWTYRLYALGIAFKASADAFQKAELTTQGYLWLGTGAASPQNYIRAFGANQLRVGVNFGGGDTGSVVPAVTGVVDLGSAGNRWNEIFAVNGTINTSDAKEKQQIRDVSLSEKIVAEKCKKLLKAFKWNKDVSANGEKAKVHFGVIAQDVKTAFESEGLNASDYGIISFDEWEEESEQAEDGSIVVTRAAGNSFGVRYHELLCFILSSM